MNRWLRNWSYRLLPGICFLCGIKTFRSLDLCHFCESDLPWIDKACPRCSTPVKYGYSLCSSCASNQFPWKTMLCPFYYAAPIDYFIYQFKYRNSLTAGQIMGSLLSKYVRLHYQKTGNSLPDKIIPVPLHKRRLRDRGYNQAQELAQNLSDELTIPVDARVIRRVRDTPPQQNLSRSDRLSNLKNAFIVDHSVQNLHLAIVDDVITTGATVSEIASLLLSRGAEKIEIFAIAKTDLPVKSVF